MRNFVASLLVFAATAQSQVNVKEEASKLEESGKFKEAASILQQAIASKVAAREKKNLEFELDRLERIRQDYPLTKEKLYAQLVKSIKDVTPQELDQWITEGKLDYRMIDGTQYFVGVSRSNLFWRYPEIDDRRINTSDDSAFERAVWGSCVAIKKAASASQPYVMPKQFKIIMKVTGDYVAMESIITEQ